MDILGFSSIKTEEARTTYNTDSACAWVSRANRKCRQLSRKRKLSFLAHDSALRPASPYTHTHATGSVPIWRKTLVICIKENREEGEREEKKKTFFFCIRITPRLLRIPLHSAFLFFWSLITIISRTAAEGEEEENWQCRNRQFSRGSQKEEEEKMAVEENNPCEKGRDERKRNNDREKKWPFQYYYHYSSAGEIRDDVGRLHLPFGGSTKRHTQLEPHFIGIWSSRVRRSLSLSPKKKNKFRKRRSWANERWTKCWTASKRRP